jgi:hypothetical protein
MESITIWSPPDVRLGRQTTYGDVLREVGAEESPGKPGMVPAPLYMGSPGIVDPRSRGVDSGDLRR